MPYILVYAGTIIVIKIMDIDLGLQVMKDVADAGYRIDTEKLKNFTGFLNENVQKRRLLYTLTPIVNVAFSFVSRVNYENRRAVLLDQLNILGIVEEMTPFEKELYNKRPTKFNALHSSITYEMKLRDAKIYEVDDENETSKIYFEMKDNIDDIVILKAEGDASRLTPEEQKEKVANAIKKAAEKYMEEEAAEDIISIENVQMTKSGNFTEESKKEFNAFLDELTPAERKEVKRQLKLLKKELIKANKQLAKQEKNSRSLQLKRNKQ